MFGLFQRGSMGSSPTVYFPATAGETYKAGEALVITSGAVTKCGATVIPQYISAGDIAADSGEDVPCYKVSSEQTYLGQLTVSDASLKIGDKVTISSDGLGVTANTTNGVAQIVFIDGTDIGDTVGINFNKKGE